MRYLGDQNKVVVLIESGTYTVGKEIGSRWPGEVTDFTIEESENLITDRYLGNSSRSYGNIQNGPVDITATLTCNVQDGFMLAHAIGSVSESDATNTKTVIVTERNSDVLQNPFISGTTRSTTLPVSFTFENSKVAVGTGKNFLQRAKGCVIDTYTLNLSQGEKVNSEVGLVGQWIEYASGTSSTITARSVKPFLWNSASFTMFGSSIDTAKELSLEINNNIEPPHYLNGSRVIAEPYAKMRDYLVSVTADMDSDLMKLIYDQYYKGGSTFNAKLDMNQDVTTTGSQHVIITMSGCRISTMEITNPIEEANEFSMEIIPKNLYATIYDHVNAGSYATF